MKFTFEYKTICHIRYALINSDHKVGHSFFVCWLLFIARMIGYLLRSPCAYKVVDEVLVVIPSANNKRSVQPILDSMRHKNYTCVERFYNFLPMGKIYFKSLLRSREFTKLYRSSSYEEKNMIRAHFDEFAPAREIFNSIGAFFDHNPQIKLLIVSNDHISVMRSFICQAINHGVKTLYTQHASVSEFFPQLIFDYSFLDGKESFLKYQSIGSIKGKVFLVGSPRFDVITQLERHESDLVGIAFNLLDQNEKILTLVKKLKDNGYHNIVVRPHPQQDKTNPDWSIFTNEGCEVSHPLQENPFKFISRLSFLIAGASSIHLEAALLRIPSAIFNMQTHNGNLDYYGYSKMKLTPIASDVDSVVELIKNPQLPSIETIRYYDAAFGTEYDGKSASLAAHFIDAFLEKKEEDLLATLFEESLEGYYIIKS